MSLETVFGLHAVESLIRNAPERVRSLYVQQSRHDKRLHALVTMAREAGLHPRQTEREELDEMADGRHQGVVARCEAGGRQYHEKDIPSLLAGLDEPPFVLVLDGVTDPHNLGACLRSADAAGVHLVIAPKDKSVGLTPVVRKVACGAAETIPFIQVTNLVRALEHLKKAGIWIAGAAGEAEQELYQADLKGPIAVALGAEGAGLRRLTREHCDFLIKIPMAGSVSSLNVSVATGIFLFEVVRRRRQT